MSLEVMQYCKPPLIGVIHLQHTLNQSGVGGPLDVTPSSSRHPSKADCSLVFQSSTHTFYIIRYDRLREQGGLAVVHLLLESQRWKISSSTRYAICAQQRFEQEARTSFANGISSTKFSTTFQYFKSPRLEHVYI